MNRRYSIVLAATIAILGGCSWDTCAGTTCGDPCWVCSIFDDDCGTRSPDGTCTDDGSCNPGHHVCRVPPAGS